MVIDVVYTKCKHNTILITDVLWDWWFWGYINSSTLVMKTVLWLIFWQQQVCNCNLYNEIIVKSTITPRLKVVMRHKNLSHFLAELVELYIIVNALLSSTCNTVIINGSRQYCEDSDKRTGTFECKECNLTSTVCQWTGIIVIVVTPTGQSRISIWAPLFWTLIIKN